MKNKLALFASLIVTSLLITSVNVFGADVGGGNGGVRILGKNGKPSQSELKAAKEMIKKKCKKNKNCSKKNS